MIFYAFAKEFGWSPEDVAKLTVTQVAMLSHYMKAAAEESGLETGVTVDRKAKSGDANRRAMDRLRRQGITNVVDTTTMSRDELKRRYGGGRAIGSTQGTDAANPLSD